MIKKLRIKFIAAAMLSLTLVLVVILGGVNLLSLQQVVRDADSVLAILSENRGDFPQREFPDGQRQGGDPFGAHTGRYRNLSPETPYETRYFSILLDSSGQVLESDTGQIVAIDDETAAEFAQKVYDSGRTDGFLGEYRYLRSEEDGNIRIIFLDCGRSLTNLRTMLFAGILVSLLGLAAVLLLLILFSRRIVRPLAESYEKQRRFITDAGHELKTPLTIIGADTDLAEMELGENEWLADIRRQAERLTGLTNDLIYLSRMEEEQPKLSLIEFPLSDVAEETAQSFLAPARTQGKTLSLAIEPMLSFYGEEKSIRQLLSILLDNALKYSPEGGEISLSVRKQNRSVVLTVSNPSVRPLEKGEQAQLFDRFYRGDPSRSGEGGYGLGLSIAAGIAAAHRGKIRAESPDGVCLVITAVLPA